MPYTHYVPSAEDYDKVDNLFVYHPAFPSQVSRYEFLRSEAKNLAHTILSHTPKSREQSLAITTLQEAIMWANAAIAINESNKSGE